MRNNRSCLSSLLIALGSLLIVGGLVCGGISLLQFVTEPSGAAGSSVNILILGIDRRPGQGYVVRSDTMILVAVRPDEPRISLLSIPRDLYVHVPGRGEGRINTAHFWGENEAEGKGPVLAMQTVAQNFGVPVHHYVRLDFDGFRAMVDGVGGIDIVVEEPIVDNAYPTEDYGTTRIEIPAGPQHMDGETALRYARSRHGSSDFERTERQQQVLHALAQRLLDPRVWPRLPSAYWTTMSYIDTDLTSDQIKKFALTLRRVGADNIDHHVIGREMVQSGTTPSGGAVLHPKWELIRPLVTEWFNLGD